MGETIEGASQTTNAESIDHYQCWSTQAPELKENNARWDPKPVGLHDDASRICEQHY